MLLSHRKNGLTSLFKEVRVFKVASVTTSPNPQHSAVFPRFSSFSVVFRLLAGLFESLPDLPLPHGLAPSETMV